MHNLKCTRKLEIEIPILLWGGCEHRYNSDDEKARTKPEELPLSLPRLMFSKFKKYN